MRALLVGLLAAVGSYGADLYRVSGVIVNAETGAPLPQAYLELFRQGERTPVAHRVTGDDGRFAFEVPQGKYTFHGGTRDAREPFGARRPDAMVGAAVVTGPELDTTNLVFRWYPMGAISGRIVDEHGEPVEDALVQLLLSRVYLGRRTTATWGWTRTDDRGEYRFGRLIGATYYLAVTGQPWHSRGAREGQSTAFAPTYSGGGRDRAGAAPIVLKPGEEARADFTLATVPAVAVTVKHDAPEGASGTVGLTIDGIGGAAGYQRQEGLYGNRAQVFSATPAGRYELRIQGVVNGVSYSGARTVDVGGADMTVDVKVSQFPVVSGMVQMKRPGVVRRAGLYVTLAPLEAPGGFSTLVKADGSFQFPAVPVGKYRVFARSTDGLFASDIRVEGTEFREGTVDLQGGQNVTVRMTASDETGKVDGLVVEDGKPLEGMMVVLAPADERADASLYHGYVTDTDGSFEWKTIPAGEYILFAVDDPNVEYGNPLELRKYRSGAKRVRVEAGSSSSHRLAKIEPEKQ